jgi:hypothetical protein
MLTVPKFGPLLLDLLHEGIFTSCVEMGADCEPPEKTALAIAAMKRL